MNHALIQILCTRVTTLKKNMLDLRNAISKGVIKQYTYHDLLLAARKQYAIRNLPEFTTCCFCVYGKILNNC